MPTINTNHYSATTQAIADAVARSIAHNESVTLECHQQHTREAIEQELEEECDGSAITPEWSDFWGRNLDGEEWRVHVCLA